MTKEEAVEILKKLGIAFSDESLLCMEAIGIKYPPIKPEFGNKAIEAIKTLMR